MHSQELPMTMARAHLVDVLLTRWYRCITRCVRRACVLCTGDQNRKEWLENWLVELADCQSAGQGSWSFFREPVQERGNL
jgi:hypothetical protein